MATQPRLVNKQFNSPIGLYSDQNVREVLEREAQILANGAVGINFHNPSVGKPSNLQNSAVLRMLEEEEHRQRNGHSASNDFIPRPLRENIKWPPPEYEVKHRQRSTFKDVVTPGVKRVAWPPPQEGGEGGEQGAVQAQGGPQYTSQTPGLQNNYSSVQKPVSPSPAPLKPLNISTGVQSPNIYQSPSSPNLNQTPAGFRPSTPNRQWAPVHSPVGQPGAPLYQAPAPQQYQAPPQQYQPPPQQYQAPLQQYQAAPQQYQAPPQQYQAPPQQYQAPPQQYQAPPQQYQAPPQPKQFTAPLPQYQPKEYIIPIQHYQAPDQQYQVPQQYQPAPQQYQAPPQQYQAPPPQPQQYQPPQPSAQPVAPSNQVAPRTQSAPTARPVEPPPSTITLRPQAPVSQAPPPLVTSQPATATFKGGKNLRGDLKWPPETVKQQMDEENRQRIELARGPAFRPRKVRKDYSSFFAQHALNSSYPGYKIPPGTQFYRV